MEIIDAFNSFHNDKTIVKLFDEYVEKVDQDALFNYLDPEITNDQLIKLLKEAIKTGKKIKAAQSN